MVLSTVFSLALLASAASAASVHLHDQVNEAPLSALPSPQKGARYSNLLRLPGMPSIQDIPSLERASFFFDGNAEEIGNDPWSLKKYGAVGKPKNPSPWPWDNSESYYGIRTFGRPPTQPVRCFGVDNTTQFDIAIVGAPFDTATSYRPGARFGPNGIRQGSQMIGGYNRVMGVDPYAENKVIDCGDMQLTLFDNIAALDSIESFYSDLISKPSLRSGNIPRVLTLGGDHTIVLPILRALEPKYGPITVIHFDSHLDTWEGKTPITHGNYFYIAYLEKLMSPDRNIHVGIKNGMWNRTHHNDEGDDMVGFSRVHGEEIEEIGIQGVVKRIRDRVGTGTPVYLTFDIDVIDPGFAPATGTPATYGYSPREIQLILKGLAGLNIIGADLVEVAPPFDTQSEQTAILAAQICHEFLSLMALSPGF